MPNLDTRLTCIRDLCSASLCGLEKREDELTGLTSSEELSEDQPSLGDKLWLEVIEPYAQPNESEALLEVARLLDDVLEAILSISDHLGNLLKDRGTGSWGEIARHAQHIRDHFDYAEDALVSIIRPAEEYDNNIKVPDDL